MPGCARIESLRSGERIYPEIQGPSAEGHAPENALIHRRGLADPGRVKYPRWIRQAIVPFRFHPVEIVGVAARNRHVAWGAGNTGGTIRVDPAIETEHRQANSRREKQARHGTTGTKADG